MNILSSIGKSIGRMFEVLFFGLSMDFFDKIAELSIRASRRCRSHLDTDWEPKYSDMEYIGMAISIPDGQRQTYGSVSVMFPHLSKRQCYKILDTRKRLDNYHLSRKKWINIWSKIELSSR